MMGSNNAFRSATYGKPVGGEAIDIGDGEGEATGLTVPNAAVSALVTATAGDAYYAWAAITGTDAHVLSEGGSIEVFGRDALNGLVLGDGGADTAPSVYVTYFSA